MTAQALGESSTRRLFPGGKNGRALLVEKDPKNARDMARLLRTVVGATDIRETYNGIERNEDWDVVIVNYDQLAALERERLFARFGALNAQGRLLLLGSPTERELISLFGRHHVRKLIGPRGRGLADDLLATVQKTQTSDIFGLDKYLDWGAHARHISLRSSDDKQLVLDQCHELAGTLSLGDRKTSLLATVAEELTTNALYDAPVDAGQAARYASLSRSSRVDLAIGEEIRVTLASDGRRVGISVEDPFGSLKPDTVMEYLAKCLRKGADQIDQKEGGAGLGLYYTFSSLSQFVINLEPRRRTETIGLIDLDGSFREFEQRPKSFNLFVRE